MTIVKIAQNDNGSHNNQTITGYTPDTFPVPDGYAVLPEEVGTPETLDNFPFGEITVEDRDGVPTVTSWTPGVLPDPGPEPEQTYGTEDMMKALLGA